MDKDVGLLILSIVLLTSGLGLLFYLGNKKGYTSFLGTAHWFSLIILIIAGIATWVAMVWIKNPDKFSVNSNQWVSLGASVAISVLWWARYVYIISDSVATNGSK